jgi:DNA repair protein RecO (recombination protein O)
MLIQTPAIICAVRHHAEHGAIVRVMTSEYGLMAGYVRGARSRTMRPVLVASNQVFCTFRARIVDQLPSLAVELEHSRGPLIAEPLPAAALDWATALTAATLPENHSYPPLYAGLEGVLAAIEAAPAARGWALALHAYEELLLSNLGYGGHGRRVIAPDADWPLIIQSFVKGREPLAKHLFEGRKSEILAARDRLVDRLKRAVA